MNKSVLFAIVLLCYASNLMANFSLQKLQVNYQVTPLGTDIKTPQFSWQMKALDNQRGYHQQAYQIIVTDEAFNIIWNSRKVESDISVGIEYKGEPLKPTTRYHWNLSVWDKKGNLAATSSWFETGMLSDNLEGWSGAKWIGGSAEDMVLYAHYLSVFKIQYQIQLDKASNSSKASFVFGANDPRLLNKNLNLMGVENKINQSYIAIELDISSLSQDLSSVAKLNIYRVGYTSTDKKDLPFKSFTIPQSIINDNNKFNYHQIVMECNFGVLDFYIDGNDMNHKIGDSNASTQSFSPTGLNLNPVGSGNNFISFPMLNDIGFKTDANQIANFSSVEIKNLRKPSNNLFYEIVDATNYKGIFKSTSIQIQNNFYHVLSNSFFTANPSKNASPMLRTEFKAAAKIIKKARLYVTARGIYEVYMNGKRIGNDYFNPGLTQYNKNHMYQTYDVTGAINPKAPNVLGACMSEGWWSGNITFSGDSWNYFGDRQSLLAKLVITYSDGTEQIVTTNNKDWKYFNDGPIRYSSFFQGEVYDATKEEGIKNWSTSSYTNKFWKQAVEIPLEGNAYIGVSTDFMGKKSGIDYNDFKLIGQTGENASIVKSLVAQTVTEVRPGVFVYDMGQNMVGIPKILIKNGRKGQVINMRFAEVKYPNLKDYQGNEGMIMMENIRAALATDRYILKGGDEIINPHFTFHGYRFIEITGIDTKINPADVRGQVISSVKELASKYESSDPLVNKLWQNITWSLRGNFLSIPTDCPNRNERMGWSGDISVFSKSATYLMDANPFLRRHLLGMRDVQSSDGRFTDVAPLGGGFGGTLWGSAGIVVAWETYRQYGDQQLLSEHYSAMKNYIQFLETKVNKSTGILNEGPLGDWLSPEGNKNDNTLFWMAYFAYDLEIVSKAAAILGKTNDATIYHTRMEEIKKAWNEIYIDKTSHRTVKSGTKTGFFGPPNEKENLGKTDKGQLINTQASYAIPLALNIVNEVNKPFAIQYLKETIQNKSIDDNGIERPAYSLMTGFIGTAAINEALSETGNNDIAYRLLEQKQYPSWLYSVVNGATTIWERLNSYTVENGFGGNNSMNSFNHYSFGAVAAWMYNYSLGIQRDPEVAAFKKFVLKPTPDPNRNINFAKGYYDCMYGRISSEWKYVAGSIEYKITIPPNTSATLYLPAKKLDQIRESGKFINAWKGVIIGKDIIMLNLSSGSYTFAIKSIQ
ncbi:MAG: family 78 glycoside hydrolase catalytic domain [Bacteroidota bacterium]